MLGYLIILLMVYSAKSTIVPHASCNSRPQVATAITFAVDMARRAQFMNVGSPVPKRLRTMTNTFTSYFGNNNNKAQLQRKSSFDNY